jgi:hypothetical protein
VYSGKYSALYGISQKTVFFTNYCIVTVLTIGFDTSLFSELTNKEIASYNQAALHNFHKHLFPADSLIFFNRSPLFLLLSTTFTRATPTPFHSIAIQHTITFGTTSALTRRPTRPPLSTTITAVFFHTTRSLPTPKRHWPRPENTRLLSRRPPLFSPFRAHYLTLGRWANDTVLVSPRHSWAQSTLSQWDCELRRCRGCRLVAVCTYVVLSHVLQNSVAHHILSLSRVLFQ